MISWWVGSATERRSCPRVSTTTREPDDSSRAQSTGCAAPPWAEAASGSTSAAKSSQP